MIREAIIEAVCWIVSPAYRQATRDYRRSMKAIKAEVHRLGREMNRG